MQNQSTRYVVSTARMAVLRAGVSFYVSCLHCSVCITRSSAKPLSGDAGFGERGFHLLCAGLGDLFGVFFPVRFVEQLQRQVAAEADRAERVEDRRQRGDAVSGVDAVGVGDRVARWIGRVVVEV